MRFCTYCGQSSEGTKCNRTECLKQRRQNKLTAWKSPQARKKADKKFFLTMLARIEKKRCSK